VLVYPLDPGLIFSGSRIFLTMTKTEDFVPESIKRKKEVYIPLFFVRSGMKKCFDQDPS
jgi:hypothetical protein